MVDDSGALVEHLFRTEAGNLCARLVAVFGPRHLQLVEDVIQEAMLRALRTWSYQGIPARPRGWLYRVARNLALDALRHDACFDGKREAYAHQLQEHATNLDSPHFADELVDDQLNLMFACCIPQLPRPAQVALTLKTACGFSVDEIATAFLVARPAIAQRLVRAKRQLRDNSALCEMPDPRAMPRRLGAVLEVVYLLFNEGYCASSGQALVRHDLCGEALRLIGILLQRPATAGPETHALSALICLQSSRLASRVDESETSVLLRNQDRSRWDASLVQRGFRHLERAADTQSPSAYHLEAAIAGCHAAADAFETVDWVRVTELYEGLEVLRPTPMVRLNHAIATAHAKGAENGLLVLDRAAPDLGDHYLLHLARAELLEQLGRGSEARAAWAAAARHDLRPAQRKHIEQRLRREA